jgi:hypothetical protein
MFLLTASLRLAVIATGADGAVGDAELRPSQAVMTTEAIVPVAVRSLRRIMAYLRIIAEGGGPKGAGAKSRESNTNASQCPFLTQLQ